MTEAAPAPQGSEPTFKLITAERKTRDIYGSEGLMWKILRKSAPPAAGKPEDPRQNTNQGVAVGVKTPLMDKFVARELRDANTTHAACLDAKESATVGLGHRDEKIHEVLDPLCQQSWQDVLDACAKDYWETGECFIEAVMDENDPTLVTGLHHIESAQCEVEVEEENNSELYHYVVRGETNAAVQTVMAKWGDLAELKARFSVQQNGQRDPNTTNANDAQAVRRSSIGGQIKNSQVIHIRQASNRSRWYGGADYMSAVPSIELVQCMTQHEFDFYFNRAVPEFLAFWIGSSTNTKTWEKFENMLRGNQGLGNTHKTCAVQIPGSPQDNVVQIERLAMEDGGKDGFSDKSMTLAMLITTAHGVPPMLANVALPAKIGAVNEGPNALMLIQKRKIGPAQRNFSTMLARTIGDPTTKLNQPDGGTVQLRADQFLGKTAVVKPPPPMPAAPPSPASPVAKAAGALGPTSAQTTSGPVVAAPDPNAQALGAGGPTDENGSPIHVTPGNGFKTILDGMTPAAANTMASMRQPITGSGRDPNAGLLGSASDRQPGDPNYTRP